MQLRQGMAVTLLVACFIPLSAQGQVYIWTQEQMIKYTAQNRYERFPDGRPKVPDELLAKIGRLSTAEAGIARNGYQNQFVDSLQNLHPGKKLVGRAVTLQLAPLRPDVGDVVQADWRAKGNRRLLDHQTALDTLAPGDVIVIDAFGSMPIAKGVDSMRHCGMGFRIVQQAAGFIKDTFWIGTH